jgi:hypothetical protein
MGHVPDQRPARTWDKYYPAHNEARRRARQAERRREAVGVLRLAEATAGYAAGQVGNGLAPDEARLAVVEAAAELELAASALRRLARLDGQERRVLAVQLAALGWPRVRIAAACGVSPRVVWDYLRVPGGSLLAQVLGAQRGQPPEVGLEQPLALGGCGGRGEPARGLLGPDVAQSIVEGVLLVAEAREVPLMAGVGGGIIGHSQGSVLVRPRSTARQRRRGR